MNVPGRKDNFYGGPYQLTLEKKTLSYWWGKESGVWL